MVVSQQTPDLASSAVNGHGQVKIGARVNVIQGLLDLAVSVHTLHAFDVRLSACECIKAYLYGHAPIRLYFLQRARNGYLAEEYEADNILTILLEDSVSAHSVDPYRQWIAAVLLFHLIYEDYDAKRLAMDIADGDAAKGEEVITCIQALSAKLIAGAQRGDDDRISVGYLMVLSGWLYEDPDAVNDFLGEGSNVQSLAQIVLQPSQQKGLVAGLCAFLLGVLYEFSTKDSPISRTTIHDILTTRLGREQFCDKMNKLREHPLVRDFEVLSQRPALDRPGSLPDVFLDKTFVDFLKDNYSRILRAIDREPGIEVSIIANGVQKGVSRELVDSLKSQVEDRSQALQRAESDILTLERKLGQEQADHRKAKESAAIELNRIRSINENLQKNQEEETRSIQEENRQSLSMLHDSHQKIVLSLQAEARQLQAKHEADTSRIRQRNEADLDDLKQTIRSLELDLDKSNKDHAQDLRTAHEEYTAKIAISEIRLKRAEERAADAEERVRNAQTRVEEKETARSSVQTELDDLFIVLADLEEKHLKDKVRLCAWFVACNRC